MFLLASFIICFLASTMGSICGIGGGVIIKPLLDSFNIMDVKAVSFLSGCTVLAMSSYSFLRNKIKKNNIINIKIGLPLAVGGAIGGIVGKLIFAYLISITSKPEKVGAVQSICLLIVTIFTLIYTIKKEKINTRNVNSKSLSILIGFFLGMLSSFLGIGGGPINLVVLYYFFSMTPKVAAQNSLYIIFFSQLTSLMLSISTNSIPDFKITILVLMITGGILGGIVGQRISIKISDLMVERLFKILMIVMIIINTYNIYMFIWGVR